MENIKLSPKLSDPLSQNRVEIESFSKKRKSTVEDFSKTLEGFKLEPHQQIAAVGYFLLRKRAEELGVEIKDFDPTFITTKEEFYDHNFNEDHSAGRYDPELNKIAHNGISLSVFAHELSHYLTGMENFPDTIKNEYLSNKHKYLDTKSGFGSVYIQKESEGTSQDRCNLLLFNEGVTEMLTHDICEKITLRGLSSLYKKLFPKQAKENLKQGEATYLRSLKRIEENKKRIYEEDKNNPTFSVEELEKQIEFQNNCSKKSFNKLKFFPFSHDESGYNVNPLTDKKIVGYKEMVDLVAMMLDGIALKKSKEEKNTFEKSREIAWQDMQREYFRGNTMYLRVLESIYGEGFLKKLSSLDFYEQKKDEKGYYGKLTIPKIFHEIEKIVKSKNNSLKETV